MKFPHEFPIEDTNMLKNEWTLAGFVVDHRTGWGTIRIAIAQTRHIPHYGVDICKYIIVPTAPSRWQKVIDEISETDSG
jgi:hypothetical protein